MMDAPFTAFALSFLVHGSLELSKLTYLGQLTIGY